MKKEALATNRRSQPYREGLEIGAISVKWVRTGPGEHSIQEVVPHGGHPKETVREIFDRHATQTPSLMVVTGETARGLLDLPYRSETECLEKALSFHGLKPDVLLSLGGETFSVFPLKDGLIQNIISTSKCAAGTGEFIVQQFQRMGLSLENGLEAAQQGSIVTLATRCSVHCKSDATHKLNKGECRPSDIARSLIHDLATKVSDMLDLAQWPTRSIVVAGGVSLNQLFVDTLRGNFKKSTVTVLPESAYLEAFGASLFASELSSTVAVFPSNKLLKTIKNKFSTHNPLEEAERLLDYRVRRGVDEYIVNGAFYILGVDAGSTTTKAVLLNASNGLVGASCYLRTLGNPVVAVKKCLHQLAEQVGQKAIRLVQICSTGSAREIVSVYLDNCLSVNEILAHARAAAEAVPDVDTVFEIGGQDSKFISFLEGVPIDYAMNEGCSAGTGSFLEESASVDMGIATDQVSEIAERSRRPIAFGERCAAFINTDLRSALQQGAAQEDVVAGLVCSIADNYISRIVGPRHIGENLLFLGGVALNRSVALAMAARTQRKIVVPPHPELMGSVGAALMARDRLRDGDLEEADHQLDSLADGDMEAREPFRCAACENKCEIQRIALRGNVHPFGGLCSKFENLRHGEGSLAEGRDLVEVRNQMMFRDFGPEPVPHPRGKIGLPLALTTYELFPFYSKLITELGYEWVLSKPSKAGNSKARSAICYPCEIVHGAVHDLTNQEVDFLFLPHVTEMDAAGDALHGYTCPSTAVIPDLIRAAFEHSAERVLSPHLGLTEELMKTTLEEIGRLGPRLGVTPEFARSAGEQALSHYRAFQQAYRQRGAEELERIQGEPAIILAGRPYTTCSSEVNLALPRKIASKGYHVIPVDMLPPLDKVVRPRDVWHFTQQVSNAVAHAKTNPDLYICLVSCFSCGPDSSMYHFFRQELAGHTFCYLEIDSHTAHAGFETRLGAFLDIIEERRRTAKKRSNANVTVDVRKSAAPASEFQPARLSEDLDYIIDSDGQRVEYDDPRVTHVWTVNHSPFTMRMIEKVYERSERSFRPAEPTSAGVMQYAKELCSGRECVPMTAMAGATLKDIQARRDPDEITIYFNVDQQGPCQNGAWPVVWDAFCRTSQLRNVVCGVLPIPANHSLGLTAAHSKSVDQCLLLGDLFTEAEMALKCLAEDRVSALKRFEIEGDRFAERFIKGGDGAIEDALNEWAAKMADIPRKTTLESAPKVLVFGGLNLLFVHEPVTDYFLEHGIVPKVIDFSEGTNWIASESIIRYGFKKGLVTPAEQFSCFPKRSDGKEAVEVRKAKLAMKIMDSLQIRFRGLMEKSGLLFDRHVPFRTIAESGHDYVSYNAFTETSTTTGRYISAAEGGIYDGLVNLGSFNCQPAMNSQATIRPLANKSDIPYVALDCEGPWISTNQRRLLETLAVQARRVRERKNALGASGGELGPTNPSDRAFE